MLTIENGTGVTDADTFIDVAEFDAITVAFFGGAMAGEKEPALRRSWVYMSALAWKPDLWPTFGGTIPKAVKDAQAILTRTEVTEPGSLSPAVKLAGRKVLNKVGEVGFDVDHGPASVEAERPVVTMAMDMLAPYLAKNPAKTGGTAFVARA